MLIFEALTDLSPGITASVIEEITSCIGGKGVYFGFDFASGFGLIVNRFQFL